MVPGQGAAERQRRNPSVGGGEPDAIPGPEPETQRQPPTEEESEAGTTQGSQVSPRRCEPSGEAEASLQDHAPSVGSMESNTVPDVIMTEARPVGHARVHSLKGPVDPPITKHTLSELDVTKIIHNPKLRHDINFDPELHFRPNIEGEKGRKKLERSDSFWRTLLNQLEDFVADPVKFFSRHGKTNDWCLPVLLNAIHDILHTLVPQRDRQFLDEGLNVDLLMQQFYRGILNLENLAQWLSGVLKSHCAPMRDEEVDTMYRFVSTGNQSGDLHQLVIGLKELLSVLEHMKLDVANHQIRCLRPVLIEDTIHFEQRYFCKRIQSGKLDIRDARRWYKHAQRQSPGLTSVSSSEFGEMHALFQALVTLVLPSSARQKIPETFQHDHERILKLRSDILDAVNLDVCMRLYHDLENLGRCSSHHSFLALDDESAFPASRPLSTEFSLAAPAVNSRPSSLVLSSSGSATSSPRSSLVVPSYVASDQHESKVKARNLHHSLTALLHQAPHAASQEARWRAIAPSMALQIFRYTNAPPDMLPDVERKLMDSLCQPDPHVYREIEHSFKVRLMAELGNRVREFKGLSGVSLYSAATESRLAPNNIHSRIGDQLDSLHEEGGVEDMATRLAHVGILHWRVWAPLAYADDDIETSV